MNRTLARLERRVRAGARNALELARLGRLGEPYSAPYEIVDQGEHHRLRRYAVTSNTDDGNAPVALLIPPLMVTAEIYDMAPEVSAVASLGAHGVVPYIIDYGAPEREAGGMKRTLDDHVRAVVSAIRRVAELSGKDVHVCGYSQGGMFAYQGAAFLRSEHVRSLVTFGSPVDIHRNLPAIRSDVAGALLRYLSPLVSRLLVEIEGLPGFLTSTGFKLLSPRAELQQRLDFVRVLHDRSALVRREARRHFLGGAGFVAWPGPAFREFVEDFVVHNRMLSGGFVIDGRTVTLADLRCPILAFVGTSDEIARPATVYPIVDAAPDAEVSFVKVPAGHFGIVVGSRANQITWPTVAEWMHWREGTGPQPEKLRSHVAESPLGDELEDIEIDVDVELFLDTAKKTARSIWRRVGELSSSASDAVDAVRWQEPRLRRLARLEASSRISPARSLAEQARRAPSSTFFLWRDRAFSYGDADTRVSNVVRGLLACGVQPGDFVGVVMGSRPSFLIMVTALNRLGAVAVIAPPDAGDEELAIALGQQPLTHVASDPELAARTHRLLEKGGQPGLKVLVLGGGGGARKLSEGLVDMEAIDPAQVALPADFVENGGRARDVAMILLRPSDSGELRAATVTNHRWALSALGAAAACTLKPGDTVYCCLPLHHPTGILASVGAAVAGGTRLALGESFAPDRFLGDVRRYGATVAFYSGEMLRALLFEKPGRGDRSLPLRLFAGSGLRRELAASLRERFGVSAIEFYAGTSHRVVLAGISGGKPGSLGRPLPGSASVAVLRCSLVDKAPVRDEQGYCLHASVGEMGLLAACVEGDDHGPGVIRDVLSPGDRWFITGDVVVQDADGDTWFVDSLGGFVATAAGPVSTRNVEGALLTLPEVRLAAAWPSSAEGSPIVFAGVVCDSPLDEQRIATALARLPPAERPRAVLRLATLPLSDGFRPRKRGLPTSTAGQEVLWLSPPPA